MKTEYKTFQFSLLAMAPIHIGNGENILLENLSMKMGTFIFLIWVSFIIAWWRKDTIKSLSVFTGDKAKRQK